MYYIYWLYYYFGIVKIDLNGRATGKERRRKKTGRKNEICFLSYLISYLGNAATTRVLMEEEPLRIK